MSPSKNSDTHPENFSSFYTNEKLGFDLKIVQYCYKSYLPFFRGKTCLELGPATGYMTQFLVKDFRQVTVVEGSKSLIDQIPEVENLTKIHSLFEDFTPSEKFDTIIMNHVLEHIENPESLLTSIKSWLASNGVFILGVPNAKSFHRLAAVKMGLLDTEYQLNERDKALGHYRVYDMAILKKQTLNAEFKILETGGVFLKFLSNAQIENFLSDSILDAYYELGKSFKENCAEIFIIAT